MNESLSLLNDIQNRLLEEIKRYRRADFKTGSFYFYDPALEGPAGFTTALMLASFMGLERSGELRIAKEISLGALLKQRNDGGVVQPYNRPNGSLPLVDVVEFAAVAGNLRYLFDSTGDEKYAESLLNGSSFLLTRRMQNLVGAIEKNENTKDHAVINASAYAANAWLHCYSIYRKDEHFEAAVDCVKYLINCLARHGGFWWPYSETLDGCEHLGRSVSYQASILALLHEVGPELDVETQCAWSEVAVNAKHSVIDALIADDVLQYESPSWSRDWSKVFEIDWFLFSCASENEKKSVLIPRLQILNEALRNFGSSFYESIVIRGTGNATPVTSAFRRFANLAGCIARIESSIHGPEQI